MEYITLVELNYLIKEALEGTLEPTYWVVGEIGELRVNQRGHCYMELVETHEDQLLAKIRANIWAYAYRGIKNQFEKATGQPLQPGINILAQVSVQFHPIYGLSINVKNIDPSFTLGEREKRKAEIMARLEAEQLLEKNRQLALPQVPQRVAVISSPTAAGYEDFVKQLQHNPYGYVFEIRLVKAMMQGQEAPISIIGALEQIKLKKDRFDVVVIIRGGGAAVDLDCFNRYDIAAAMANFPLPLLTGIGHERDKTVADEVAHTAFKTPTAVSAFLIDGMATFEQRLYDLMKQVEKYMRHRCKLSDQQLQNRHANVRNAASMTIQHHAHALERLSEKVKVKAGMRHQEARARLNQIAEKLRTGTKTWKTHEEQRLSRLEHSLDLMDPEHVFQRGYSFSQVNGKPLASIRELNENDELTTQSLALIVKSRITTWKRK